MLRIRKRGIEKKGMTMIEVLVALIICAVVLVLGVLVYVYLFSTDVGLIVKIRNFFRFGG